MNSKVKANFKPQKPAFKKAPGIPQDSNAVKKEKNRVMKSNMDSRVMQIMKMNMEKNEISSNDLPFVSRFLKNLIKEQEEPAQAANLPAPSEKQSAAGENNQKAPAEFNQEGDKQAFDNAMEPTTDKGEFDVDGVSPKMTSETIKSIKEWSVKLDEFASFLNDPSTDSLHKILADGDRAGSLLRGVTRKASDSITRIAGEVEKLKEILNTYIITAPKKLRDTESQVAGWTQY